MKRWCQLSIPSHRLDSVIATFIVLNFTKHENRIVVVVDPKGQEWQVLADTAGWPFTDWRETIMLRIPEINAWAFVGNGVVFVAVLLFSLVMSSLLPSERKQASNHDHT